MNLKGRCLCSAVQYTVKGNPLLVFLCHCRDCQQSGGSLFHFGVMVAESQFKRHGEVRAYAKLGDSRREITREFCPICGSGIDYRLERVPGTVVIKGGTLEDPSAVASTFELYARSKASCVGSGLRLQSFEQGLTADPSTLIWKGPDS